MTEGRADRLREDLAELVEDGTIGGHASDQLYNLIDNGDLDEAEDFLDEAGRRSYTVITAYAHADTHTGTKDKLVEQYAENGPADETEIRGLGYEVELTYRLYEDGELELVSAKDGKHEIQ